MDWTRSFDFAGRTALVVGASRGGIGSAIAAGLQACGAAVTITGAEAEVHPDLVGRHPYHRLDLSDLSAVQELVQGLDRLDLLVNCAGIAARGREWELDTFRRVMEVNLFGLFNLAVAAKAKLAESRGAMLTVASMFATFASPFVPAYGASKAATAQMTRSLAVDWAPLGIRVNALAPGFIETEQTLPGRSDPAYVQKVLARTPMGRWGKPDDLVGPALFLLSPAAAFVTGHMLAADGGYSVAQ